MTLRKGQAFRQVFDSEAVSTQAESVGQTRGAQDKEKLFTIKEFAKVCRTTPRTLRFYEEKGLFKPYHIDSYTNYRYYQPVQAREFFQIKLLNIFDIPLKEIKIAMKQSRGGIFLKNQMKSLRNQIIEKEKEYEFLKQIRYFLFEEDDIESLLKEETFGPFVLFCKTVEKGRYDTIKDDFLNLALASKKLDIPLTNQEMVFYLDPVAYKPVDTKLEICLITKFREIPEKIILPQGYYFKNYPKTRVRSYTYRGPYDYINLIYYKFYEKKQNKKLEPHERGIDLHLDGPWNKKSAYDFVTKIAFPLK